MPHGHRGRRGEGEECGRRQDQVSSPAQKPQMPARETHRVALQAARQPLAAVCSVPAVASRCCCVGSGSGSGSGKRCRGARRRRSETTEQHCLLTSGKFVCQCGRNNVHIHSLKQQATESLAAVRPSPLCAWIPHPRRKRWTTVDGRQTNRKAQTVPLSLIHI